MIFCKQYIISLFRMASMLLFITFLVCCHNKKNKQVKEIAQYKKWIIDNKDNLDYKKVIGDFELNLKYIPIELMILRDNEFQISKEEVIKQKDNYKSQLYFDFKILANNGEDLLMKESNSQEDINKNMSYLSFGIQKELFLINKHDTMHCILSIFQRDYNKTNEYNFFLVFENKLNKNVENENIEFLYNDTYLGLGKVFISIPKENIEFTAELIM